MSLLRRLLSSVLLVMVIVLAGTLVFSVNSARSYLNEQLDIQAQNVGTTLALVLSQEANRDPVTRELLLTAVFDTAMLSSIRFSDVDGQVQFERRQAVEEGNEGGSPAWFDKLLPFAGGVATRDVSDGWSQLGELQLSIYPGQARAMLWRSTLEICALFVAACVLLALFLIFLMATVKRMLRQMVEQPVENFGRNENWQGEDEASRALAKRQEAAFRELQPAAEAVRDMRVRVSASVKERSEKIESLQLELNTDSVTGLANRRYFVNALLRQLQGDVPQEGSEVILGHVILMRQRDLATINQQMTRIHTDEWLKELAGQLLAYAKANLGEEAVLARLNGSDLALLVPRSTMLEANRHAQALLAILSARRISLGEGRWCRWALAMTDFAPADEVSNVFKYLDQALMQAEHAGHGEISYLSWHDSRQRTEVTGQSLWRERIERGLSQHDFQLSFQCWEGVNSRSYYPLRYEATLGMLDREENQLLSAYLLMPVAARVGLSGQCDARALALALSWLDEQGSAEVVLRFSLVSLIEPEFEREVSTLLARHANAAPRLIIELDAFTLSAQARRDYGGDVLGFCQRLHAQYGVRFGLRALTQQIDVLYRLGELACAYIKLGDDFIDLLNDSTGARELLRAVIRTARSSGIEVVTMRVSDPDERDWLKREGVGSLLLGSAA